MASGDLVATWDVPLPDGVHKIEFEHGTTSGKRIIRVDGKEIYREDWMFKLVGKEHFEVGNAKCTISIDAVSGFAYEYLLEVNGKPLKKFKENQTKIQRAWCLKIAGHNFRVCLEKNTLDVYVNGDKVETFGEFTEEGTETHFEIGAHSAIIKGYTTGKRREGVQHKLFVDEVEIPEAKE